MAAPPASYLSVTSDRDPVTMAYWEEVKQLYSRIWAVQGQMVQNASYLQAGAHTRANKYVRMIQKDVERYSKAAEEFDRQIPQIMYNEGFRSVAAEHGLGLTNYTPPPHDVEELRRIGNLSKANHWNIATQTRKQTKAFGTHIRNMGPNPFQDQGELVYDKALKKYVRDEQGNILRQPGGFWEREKLQKYVDTHGVRGTKYEDGTRARLTSHEAASIKAVRARAFNLGRIRGLEVLAGKQGKGEYLEVSDGPGCGWGWHDDPETADGKIVTFDEARAYPIAHPNCRRMFNSTTKKPPGAKEDKKAKKESAAAKAGGRLETAVKITAAVVAGAEASNLAVASIARLAQSRWLEGFKEEILIKAMERSDPQAYALAQRISNFQARWDPIDHEETQTMVVSMLDRRTNTILELAQLPQAAGAEQFAATTSAGQAALKLFGRGLPEGDVAGSVSAILDAKRAAVSEARRLNRWVIGSRGNDLIPPGLPEKLSELEKDIKILSEAWVNKVILSKHIPQKIQHLFLDDFGWEERFSIFHRMLRSKSFRALTGPEMRSALQLERRAKRIQQLSIFEGTRAASGARWSWTQWGPRVRVDLTEWLRGRMTLTETGLIQNISVRPIKALRGSVKMFQDGTLGGSLSLIPKGIFRAIVEVDEFGGITGNVRLVRLGPIKLKLEFATPRPSNWHELGLLPGADFVDWRVYQATGKNWAERIQAFNLQQAWSDVRKMELKRVVIDLKLFNTNLVELATDLRVPMEDVRAAVREGMRLGRIYRKSGGGLFGQIAIPIERGVDEFLGVWAEGLVKASLKPNFKFDLSFQQPVLHGLIRPRIHLESGAVRNMIVGMKIRGYSVYDIGTLLDIDARTIRSAYESGVSSVRMFMSELGANTLQDVRPLWQSRIETLIQMRPNRKIQTEADLIQEALNGFLGVRGNLRTKIVEGADGIQKVISVESGRTVKFLTQGQNVSLRTMAGIDAFDGEATIEFKLRSMLQFLEKYHFDSDEVLQKVSQVDGQINKGAIRSVAREMAMENKKFRDRSLELVHSRQSFTTMRSVSDDITSYTGNIDLNKLFRQLGYDATDSSRLPEGMDPGDWGRRAAGDLHSRWNPDTGDYTITYKTYDPAHHVIDEDAWRARIVVDGVDHNGNPLRNSIEIIDDSVPGAPRVVRFTIDDSQLNYYFEDFGEKGLKRALRDYNRVNSKIYGNGLIDNQILQHLPREIADLDPETINTILRQTDFMMQRYPHWEPPEVIFYHYLEEYMNDVGESIAHYDPRLETIIMNAGPYGQRPIGLNYQRWGTWYHNWAQGQGQVTGDEYGQTWFIHELSHDLEHFMMKESDGRMLLESAFDRAGLKGLPFDSEVPWDFWNDRFPDNPIDEKLLQKIVDELGLYPATNFHELIAEANRHYLTDIHPGPIARAIGEAIEAYYNTGRQVALRR